MRQVLVVGSGNIGSMLAQLLVDAGDYAVTVADASQGALGHATLPAKARTRVLDALNETELAAALADCEAVISAAPFNVTSAIAKGAHRAGVHYLDLTEDVASTKLVKSLASTARAALIPQCGLAPGFISIVGMDLAHRFEKLHELRMRVGALPQYPSNALSYNLTWSTVGVINEYCEPCEAVVGGKLVSTPALEELEHFALHGVQYEAFNTSGGLGTLAETLLGRIGRLSYKTIRYPGHRDIMKTLLQDLRLSERRDLLAELLERAVPATMQDVVVIFVTAIGMKGDRLMQDTYANAIYPEERGGRTWAAIQLTTASAACAVLDLLFAGKLPLKGFVRQEQIKLEDFLTNRFGKAYAQHRFHTVAV
jgi:saccharopine dehydrogenase-like NADP-dependent oxidoreductase